MSILITLFSSAECNQARNTTAMGAGALKCFMILVIILNAIAAVSLK